MSDTETDCDKVHLDLRRERQRLLWKKCDSALENHLLSLMARHFLPPRGKIVSFTFLQLASGRVIAHPNMECEAQIRFP